MSKNQLITEVILEETISLTLEEFSQAIHADKEVIVVMVEYELLKPHGHSPHEWRFDARSLRRGRTAASFYHDLEVNLPGVALALELLDKIENLQHQVEILEKMIQE